jgi:hypothetical protein
MRRKRIILGLFSSLLLVLGLASAVATSPPARAVGIQTCNRVPLCLNVQGGSHAYGTPITGYTRGDRNGQFQFLPLTAACGDGHVHIYANGGCPFAVGTGENQRNDGAAIIAIRDYSGYGTIRCADVSDTPGTGGGMYLGSCPDNWANGGPYEIWVTGGVANAYSGEGNIALINVGMSDQASADRIPCSFTRSAIIYAQYANHGNNHNQAGCQYQEQAT